MLWEMVVILMDYFYLGSYQFVKMKTIMNYSFIYVNKSFY